MDEAVHISLKRIRFAENGFDSQNRYIRQVADPADKTLNMCRGSSIGFTTDLVGSSNVRIWRWQMKIGDVVVDGIDSNGNAFGLAEPTGFNESIDAAL